MYKKFAYILLFTIIFNICLTLSPFHINIANAEDSSMSKSKQDFQLQPGDIIITKGPVLFGFLVIQVSPLIMIRFYKLKALVTNLSLSHLNHLSQDLVKVKMTGLKYIVALSLVPVKKLLDGLRRTMKILIIDT